MLALSNMPILFTLSALILGSLIIAGIYRMNASKTFKWLFMGAIFLFVVLPSAVALLYAIF
jgi:hypothetical protein